MQEYHTKDLYRPHPTLKNHWIYQGRADNIIVFSTGEKLNPVSIEDMVMSSNELKGALVVGTDRFQPALILEPVKFPQNDVERDNLINRVWPLVVRANKETVAHGQIGHQFVALSNPAKPFLRAGKGTIQRAGTVKLYKDDIDKIYANAEKVSSTEAPKFDLRSRDGLMEAIMHLFQKRLRTPHLDPDTDFFSAGVDSMQVINAARLIRAGLEAEAIQVDASAMATRVIYGNPTPRRLADYLFGVVKRGGQDAVDGGEVHEEDAIKYLVEKYTQDIPHGHANKPEPEDEGQTIIITGTTGGLGSYLLNIAAASPRVKKIICLNRSEDGQTRQFQVSHERGLDDTDFSKAEFLQADLSYSDFALGKETYDRLLRETDRIIHNQWPVNWNIPVESFEPHIRGVRHLADFSREAAKQVPIVFISSIASTDKWPHKDIPVPERAFSDLDLAAGGYGRSKLASSLILDKASEMSGIPTEVIRVGQIAGPSSQHGYWNRQEWLPSIIASSLYLGMLPSDLGIMSVVDWTPIEGMANLVLEVSGITIPVSLRDINGYFHGVNPSRTTWAELVPAVQEFYGDRIKKIVSFDEWVRELEKSQLATEDVSKNPGVKLIDSYKSWLQMEKEGRSYVIMDMTRTKERSPTMRHMKPITPALMKNWASQWNF